MLYYRKFQRYIQLRGFCNTYRGTNALKSKNVPYRCEFPLVIETAYAECAVERLAFYSANGYFTGKNLIITMEGKNSSVNSQEINRIINEYLK